MDDHQQFRKTADLLDEVSPSFCLAKWLQVTLHLQRGQTHSCHHPVTHHIPLKELQLDPSALHNTRFKKEKRRQMLEGERPEECNYCWRIEDAAPDSFSDRHFKSSDPWALPYLEQIKAQAWDQSTAPTYVEVSFSNTCNFKCAYCMPQVSSAWMQDIKKHGAYHLPSGAYHDPGALAQEKIFETEEQNPYVDAFWEWWPELSKSLHVFRLTGGEPLLSPSTMRILRAIEAQPYPHLEFYVNSNLGVPEKTVRKFAEVAASIIDRGHVKRFGLFTSLDTWGPQAEYIRDGLDLSLFIKNFDHLLETLPPFTMTFMVTFNVLSFSGFIDFLEFVMDRRRRLLEKGRKHHSLFVDTSYLRDPAFLAPQLATPELLAKGDEILRFMTENSAEKRPEGFIFFEIEKVKRMLAWLRADHDKLKLARHRADFATFVDAYDRRRNKDFASTFPDYAELLALGRLEAKFEKAYGSHD